MSDVIIRPSKKLRTLVGLFNSVNAAAEAWEVPYSTFAQWLDSRGSLPGNTVARIIERTGLAYEDLFVHEEEAAR